MKQSGMSNRAIARETGHDRGDVSKIWNRYCSQQQRLLEPGADIKAIQEEMTTKPQYNSTNRTRTAFTEAVAKRLQEIVAAEEAKTRKLGPRHKQHLTNLQIHEQLESEGFKVGRVTINTELAKLRKAVRNVYIRQQYDLGERLEYDFGEVKLEIGNEGVKTYHMAVFSSPGGEFFWTYLYTNEKQAVFMDSHVQFFEMMGGVWIEVVYDNMRNVVAKFIGRNEKELNEEFVKMAAYYGFIPNVTNCYKPNEKGHVENSVKVARNKIFATRIKFSSFEEAREYMVSQLEKLNETSKLEEEKKHLLPYKPPLELAKISENTVCTYGFICVNTAFYSVPEHLVGKKVTVKLYHDEVRVFSGNEPVCVHKRIFGKGNMTVNIYHYLNTLLKKPGAVRNSVALKSIPRLKAIFDTHYTKTPKKFIELFIEHKALSIDEIIAMFEEQTKNPAQIKALDIVKPLSQAEVSARAALSNYAALVNIGMGVMDYGECTGIGIAAEIDLLTG
jgi:flavodoxin